LNNGQKRKRPVFTDPSRLALGSLAASLTLSSLGCSLIILLLAVTVGRAQAQQPELSKTEAMPQFRVERNIIANGGELLTIWARPVDQPTAAVLQTEIQNEEIPLLSVLRDTLGDARRENDVFRQLWVHTYARPRLLQKAAALVPFVYNGLRAEPQVRLTSPPPAIIDLSDTDSSVWRRLFASGIARVLIDQPLLKYSVHSYQRNFAAYRRSNLMRALTILSLYGNQRKDDSPFSEEELIQLQAQLSLTEKTFGGIVDKTRLLSFQEKQSASLQDTRGHNWELLRQQAEASGLYIEPLRLSETVITHALLWFPVDGRASEKSINDRPFEGRFLNIKNPFRDERLRRWQGYAETKYFDPENRVLPNFVPNSRGVKMIPLALYGLDFDKIPALLIDFRDPGNPKRRELSGRLINDITSDVLSISRYGNVYYFLARSAFDFVTRRRGIDISQPSRVRSIAELKLLLAFGPNISKGLREQLDDGLQRLSVNPLENSNPAENKLALAQYKALLAYSHRPNGLPARLERERSAEAMHLVHRGLDAKLLRLANIVTLGRYTHHEKMTSELVQQLDNKRQLAYHIRHLREVAKSSPLIEVAWEMEKVLPSLRFIAENASARDNEAAKAVGAIFSRTEDFPAKDLCLSALKKIGNKLAIREMVRIYNDNTVATEWRNACAVYLGMPPHPRSTVGVSAESQTDLAGLP
jgi:hypothetical protein